MLYNEIVVKMMLNGKKILEHQVCWHLFPLKFLQRTYIKVPRSITNSITNSSNFCAVKLWFVSAHNQSMLLNRGVIIRVNFAPMINFNQWDYITS